VRSDVIEHLDGDVKPDVPADDPSLVICYMGPIAETGEGVEPAPTDDSIIARPNIFHPLNDGTDVLAPCVPQTGEEPVIYTLGGEAAETGGQSQSGDMPVAPARTGRHGGWMASPERNRPLKDQRGRDQQIQTLVAVADQAVLTEPASDTPIDTSERGAEAPADQGAKDTATDGAGESETPIMYTLGGETTTTTDSGSADETVERPTTSDSGSAADSVESPASQGSDEKAADTANEPEPPVIYTLGGDNIDTVTVTSVELHRKDVKRIARQLKRGENVELDVQALMQLHDRGKKQTRKLVERIIATTYDEYHSELSFEGGPYFLQGGMYPPARTTVPGVNCDVQALDLAYAALGSPTRRLKINDSSRTVSAPPPFFGPWE
jgi:hypothetical protein